MTVSESFDRYLASYQKICVFLVFPGLISAFSCVVRLFNESYGLVLGLAITRFLDGKVAEWNNGFLLLVSLSFSAVSLGMVFLAAKGKLWAFLAGAGLYLADAVFLFFPASNEVMGLVLGIVMHVIFLGAYAIGLFSYLKARKLLREHEKEILRKK